MVTAEQLQLELDVIMKNAEERFKVLEKQEAFKQVLFEKALILASGGSVNIVGVITTLGAILGLGAVVDNRKKDAIIKTISKNANNNQ